MDVETSKEMPCSWHAEAIFLTRSSKYSLP